MKRFIAVGVGALLLVLAVIAFVHLDGSGAHAVAPDPSMPIHLSDGRVVTLGEVLELADARREAPVEEIADASNHRAAPPSADRMPAARAVDDPRGREDPLLGMGMSAARAGRLDEAEALLLSVRPDSKSYARARRFLGWDVLTEGKHEPRRGVAYVEQAAWREPSNGNSWQDLARVYGRALGIPVR